LYVSLISDVSKGGFPTLGKEEGGGEVGLKRTSNGRNRTRESMSTECSEGQDMRRNYHECVEDNSERPDINLEAVTYFSIQDFGGDVIRRSANGVLTIGGTVDFGRKAQISDFNFHVFGEEQIAQFQVTVDDALAVHVLAGVRNLQHVVLRFLFREAHPAFDELVHGVIGAQFKNEVVRFHVLKPPVKFDNVLVIKVFVDFNFCLELLLGFGLHQSSLFHHFTSVVDIAFATCKIVTFCKTSCRTSCVGVCSNNVVREQTWSTGGESMLDGPLPRKRPFT
jgi:hypothetical protein